MDHKIALTGSTGHVGSALLHRLLDRGFQVKTLIHNQKPSIHHPQIEPIEGSLSDPKSLQKLVEGCSGVIHSAARISLTSNRDPELYEINVEGTRQLHQAALEAGVKRFIQVSSIHAYDQTAAGEVLTEESPYCSNRCPLYDRSKRDAQRWLLQEAPGQMEVVVVNPTAIAGPFDYRPSMIGQAVIDLYQRKIPLLIVGGFDFVDVRDVADGILAALEKGRNREAYLLPGKWHSLAELQQLMLHAEKRKGALTVLPGWTGFAGLPFIQLYARLRGREPLYTREALLAITRGHRCISGAKASRELGYQPRPLAQTMTDTLEWFKQQHKI